MSDRSSSPFFISGGTLSRTASSYIERAADTQLFEALSNGRYCFLLNARQMGKSSISVRTMARLRANGVASALVDLTRIGGKNVTPEQWYATLCREVADGLGVQFELRKYWQENDAISPMRRFFDFMHDVILASLPGPVVLFLDEIDVTTNLGFSADEFFAGIRQLFNRRVDDTEFERITICLVGVALPSDLIRDARVTPFNIGERITLQDFSLEEVARYAGELGPNGKSLIERIHYWTNGHPFLTQGLCAAILKDPTIQKPEDVDRLVSQKLLAPAARETNMNLADVANRALHATVPTGDELTFKAELLSIYEKVYRGRPVPDDESNRACATLKLSGLVRTQGARLHVRNRIYRNVFDLEWIRNNLPDQEKRRQRVAYTKGLLLAGSVAALVIGVIVVLALISFGEARRADLSEKIASKEAASAIASAKQAASAETRASQTAAANRLAEQRAERLYRDRDRALGVAKNLLRERDFALNQSKRAAQAEHRARLESDALRAQSDRFSFQAYSLTLRNTFAEFDKGHDSTALRSLVDLERQPQRGWELGYLSHQIHRLGRFFWASRERVTGIRFLDAHTLVTLSVDGLLSLWNVDNDRLVRNFEVPKDSRTLELLPSGKAAVLGSLTGGISCISLQDGRIIWVKDHIISGIEDTSLCRDGRRLLAFSSGPDCTVVVCSTKDGTVLARTHLPGYIAEGGDLSPDGQFVTMGLFRRQGNSPQATIKLFRAQDLKLLWDRADAQAVRFTCLNFSADSGSILCGHRGGNIDGYDTKSGRSSNLAHFDISHIWSINKLPRHSGYVLCGLNTGVLFTGEDLSVPVASRSVAEETWRSCISPSGGLLATAGNDGGVYVWRVPSGQTQAENRTSEITDTFGATALQPREYRFSPDGQFFVIKQGESASSTCVLCRTADQKHVLSFKAADICLSPDVTRVAAENLESRVELFRVRDGAFIRSLPGKLALAFSPDNRIVAVSGAAPNLGTVRIYQVATGSLLAERAVSGEAIVVGAFTPDGKHLVCAGDDDVIYELDPKTCNCEARLYGHTSLPTSLTFSEDGSRLVSSGFDTTSRVWDIRSGRQVAVFHNSGFSRLCKQSVFMRDGKRIAASVIGAINIWDLRTFRLLLTIPCPKDQLSFAQVTNGDLLGINSSGEIFRYGIDNLPAPPLLDEGRP